jgi:putative DNA primase/helicase
MFDGFPFVDDADRVALVAGIITALLRRVLPAAPLFAITAPSPGTGKTLLCETLAIVATDRRASVMSLGHDDAEFEKRLGGVLLAGDAVISIDNIERALRGDLLCQIATQQFVRLRPLGGSGMLNVPTHALLVATGNNLAIIGDLKRRVLMVRLDAHTERPEQRSFDRNHLDEMKAQRGAIITDALTIVGAYLAANEPKIAGLYDYGGFEAWDRMVRRPLAWLELPDPLLAAEGLRDQDPDLEAMRVLFSAWRASNQLALGPCTAADVVLTSDGDHELREALQVVCSEKINSRRLGNWLRAHRDKIVDGLQLVQVGKDAHAKVPRWKVSIAVNAANA